MNHRLAVGVPRCRASPCRSAAEDGYDLWLRYHAANAREYPALESNVRELVAVSGSQPPGSPTLQAAQRELLRGLSGLAGKPVALVGEASQAGAVFFGTPASSAAIKALPLGLERAGAEGYVIRSVSVNGRPATVIAANSDAGVLYGAFHFLRLVQTRQALTELDSSRSRAPRSAC